MVKEKGRKARQKLNFTSSWVQQKQEEVLNGSSSSWSVRSSDSCLWPLSVVMEQRLLLQYLTPLGDYQEVGVWTCWVRAGTKPAVSPPVHVCLFSCSRWPSSCRWTRARC